MMIDVICLAIVLAMLGVFVKLFAAYIWPVMRPRFCNLQEYSKPSSFHDQLCMTLQSLLRLETTLQAAPSDEAIKFLQMARAQWEEALNLSLASGRSFSDSGPVRQVLIESALAQADLFIDLAEVALAANQPSTGSGLI